MRKWLGFQNNQIWGSLELEKSPKFPPSLPCLPFTLDDPMVLWSCKKCPLLCPGVFESLNTGPGVPSQEKMSAAGMQIHKFKGQAAAKDMGVCTRPGPDALSRRPRGEEKGGSPRLIYRGPASSHPGAQHTTGTLELTALVVHNLSIQQDLGNLPCLDLGLRESSSLLGPSSSSLGPSMRAQCWQVRPLETLPRVPQVQGVCKEPPGAAWGGPGPRWQGPGRCLHLCPVLA